MRNVRALALALLMACLSAPPSAFARTDGTAQTEAIARSLREAGLSYELQPLAAAAPEAFPQNIIVTIPPVSAPQSAVKSTVFAFTQDFASEHREFMQAFLSLLGTMRLDDEVLVLLSADEADIYAQKSPLRIGGTEVYTLGMEDEESICAIVYEEAEKPEVIPGAASRVAPLWLSQAVMEASRRSDGRLSFPGSQLLLYRLGMESGGERLSLFLDAGIPALAIAAPPTDGTARLLAEAAGTCAAMRQEQWDSHYAAVQAGELTLWISEILFVLGYIAIITLMMLTLAFSDFASSSRNIALRKDLRRTWFMLPAVILSTALLLLLFQRMFSGIGNALISFEAKVIATCAVMQMLLCIQIRTRFRISFAVLAFETLLLSALDLIVLSSMDISLVFTFAPLYFIALVSRRLKRPVPLMLAAVLMVLPLVPHLVRTVRFSDMESLARFASTGFAGNLLVASVLFIPLSLWCRTVISLKIFTDDGSPAPKKRFLPGRRTVVRTAATVAVSSLLFAAILLVPTLLVLSQRPARAAVQETVHLSGESDGLISLSYEESTFMSISARHITVHSDTDVFRYEISVESDGGIPLYESNYEYVLESPDKASFRLPDWPGHDLEIVYSAGESGTGSTIRLDAYIAHDDGRLERVTKTIRTDGGGA